MKYFNRNLLLKESSAQQAIVARFFYSFRDGELQRSHYSMLLSILYEILHQDEGFFYHQCQAEYRAHQREDLPFKWDYGSLKKLLKSLQNYRTNNQYYLAIDAIDESEPNDRREILGLLFDLCSKMKHSVVKIFMASRPVAQLESRRDQFHNFIKLDAETRADIHKYAHSRLHDLHSTDLLTQATAHILENAQGVFLWVKLISEQLIEAYEEGYSEKELFRLLKQLPTELEDLYKLMIEKMEHNNASLLYGAKMFQFILFAKRPLTVDEVLHALGILNSADSNSKFIPSDALFEKHIPASDRIILSGGGNFLELREHNGQNIVQIMHQTVREFFLDPDGPVANSRFSVSEARGHINMAISCMRYLSMCAANTSLAGELPELNSWDSVQYKDYCQYLNRRPLASYALSYTRSHIAICGQDANVHYVVSQFIEQSANTDPSTFLLENWASLELHQSSLSNNNAEDATAMNFRCEVLRAASIYGFDIAAEIVLLAETDMENQDEDGRTPLFLAASNGHERMVKLLLDIQADINTANNNGQTCLSCAAENGHRDIVKLLVEKGASVHESDKLDRTPLLLAAENGHLETIKFLLEERADIHRFDDFHQTPLLMAAKNGHLDSVDFLARNGKEIDQGNKLHQTPLLMAVMNKHPNTAQFLIRIGANIHESDDFHQTPLIMAAENGLLDTVQLLVEEGAKIHQSDKLNRTSLFAAAENGHLDIVQFLDEKGANIHCPNNFHQTPLLIASKNGHLDIVKLLIDRGSDIYTSEESGLTCFLWAVKNGHRDIVELLAEKGKNIHEKSYLGQTPLLLAIEHDQLSVVELLVELGANINQSDYYCQTPLSKAVEHNHLSIVQFLVEKGANIECRDFFGQTPLSLAVEHNYLSIVQFLVARGACVDDRDDCGQTPLSRALINGNLDIINILKERGAIKRKRKRSPSPNSVL